MDKTQHGVFHELHQRKILVTLHYIPVHLQPYYRQLECEPGMCPEPERYFYEAMSIPLYPGLSQDSRTR